MIEKYFLEKRGEYMNNPSDAKLENLQFIQEERRIQYPDRFIKVIRKANKETDNGS